MKHPIIPALGLLIIAGCAAQAIEPTPEPTALICDTGHTANESLTECVPLTIPPITTPPGAADLGEPITVTAEPAPEPAPTTVEPEPVTEPVTEQEPTATCHEDMPCWDWRTMGNNSAGATVTIYDGEVLEGVITDNGDGTYTFVEK